MWSLIEVPVAGGSLGAAVTGAPIDRAEGVVVLVHGLAANLAAWALVAGRLDPDLAVIAVDLRGRGASAVLEGPFGMAAHAADLVAVCDHLDVATATVVGHSMGAFVASTMAARTPDRVAAMVLVDGGVPVDDVGRGQDVLEATLDVLSQTFATRADHHLYWKRHPAFAGVWGEAIEAYLDHGIGGREPRLRSRVSHEAVRFDGAEVLLDEVVRHAISRATCPIELLLVERGPTNEPDPGTQLETARALAARMPNLRVATVPNLNHYTLVLSPLGADVVGAAVGRVSPAHRKG